MTETSSTSGSHSADFGDTSYFDSIFGKPALLKGENRAAYDLLKIKVRRMLVGDVPTKLDILAELKILEVTDSIWEERRYKRFETQLIDSGHVTALEMLLQPALWNNPLRRPPTVAHEYYYGDTKQHEAAKALLACHGITAELIQAKAMMVGAGEFSYLDRLVDNRRDQRRRFLKEHERQQRQAEKVRKREASGQTASANDNAAGGAEVQAVGAK